MSLSTATTQRFSFTQRAAHVGTEVEFHREGWLDRAVRFWETAIESNERQVR